MTFFEKKCATCSPQNHSTIRRLCSHLKCVIWGSLEATRARAAPRTTTTKRPPPPPTTAANAHTDFGHTKLDGGTDRKGARQESREQAHTDEEEQGASSLADRRLLAPACERLRRATAATAARRPRHLRPPPQRCMLLFS